MPMVDFVFQRLTGLSLAFATSRHHARAASLPAGKSFFTRLASPTTHIPASISTLSPEFPASLRFDEIISMCQPRLSFEA
jgi:hypothetical protein